MQLNTLAGRSYNDITQVNLVLVKMFFLIIFDIIFSLVILIYFSYLCSILFSHGFYATMYQKFWTYQIHLITGIFPRWYY